MFIDTNASVYSRNLEAPNHYAAKEILERAYQDAEPLRISRQIVREYLAVMTRPQPWEVQISRDDVIEDANRLLRDFEILEDGPVVTDTLITLCREFEGGGKQIHDANIVATMLAHGERRLLTFNTSDFRRYTDRIELVGRPLE
ncbi:MAG: PIN domain-containing protein [Chloroflexi bacterium]|nr:PIN domain-containing protein [Chloroflexota bacterium]